MCSTYDIDERRDKTSADGRCTPVARGLHAASGSLLVGGQPPAATAPDDEETRMKITVKKVERIEATRIHPDPEAKVGAA
ncbi:hypothetical protein [Dactylosporangium darangshiense]|uniref:Uncharacterized protein n=1 Tax=Dactylosporangium darangshiense TaxID=579108 RepID=A0ABP8DHB5_9ACTN